MATKVIVLGEASDRKKIEFNRSLISPGLIENGCSMKPCDYAFIELISKDYGVFLNQKYDLMFAYNDPERRQNGTLYLGKFNDGIV